MYFLVLFFCATVVPAHEFRSLDPGFESLPYVTNVQNTNIDQERELSFSFLMVGIFLIMSLYHLALFFFRRQENSTLIFAGICLLLCIRVLVGDGVPLDIVVPIEDIRVVYWGSYLSFILLLVSFVFLVTELFPLPFNRIFRWIASIPCLLCCIVVVVAPIDFYYHFLWIFQIFSAAIALGMITLLVFGLFQGQSSALVFFFGLIAVGIGATHDLLKTYFDWATPNLAPLGSLIFVFVLALALSRRATIAINKAEEHGAQLEKINAALTRFVPHESLGFLPGMDISEIAVGDHTSQSMSVLFADIRSFSRIHSKLTSDATFQLVNRFLASAGPIIRNHGGFVEKYLGGGLMALFPVKPVDALMAALEIQKTLTSANKERAHVGHDPIIVGIGIHFGPLMIGTVGEVQRMDSTVISETVALAARLQGLTRTLGGQILVSENTVRHINSVERFHFRQVGKFRPYHGEESIGVAEFFDSENLEVWERKRATRRDFEHAVYLQQTGRFDEARAAFERHLSGFPTDTTARYYLNQVVSRRSTLS